MSSFVNILALLIRASALLIRGSGYQSLQVIQFNFQKLIQNYRLLFSFLTNKTSSINSAQLGLIKPLSRLLIRYYLTVLSLAVVIWYKKLKLSFQSPSSIILQLYDQYSSSLLDSAIENTSLYYQYYGGNTFYSTSL